MTAREALDIATEHNGGPLIRPTVQAELPASVCFHKLPDEGCWYITCAYDSRTDILRSSRLIVVSMETGKVILDEDANDEG